MNTQAIPTIFDTENEPNQNTVPLRQCSRKAPKKVVRKSPTVSDSHSMEVSSTFLDSSLSNQTANNETSLQDIVKDLSLSEKLIMDIKQEMFPIPEDGVKRENLEGENNLCSYSVCMLISICQQSMFSTKI